MSAWTLCLLVTLAVAVTPSSAAGVAAAPSPAQQVIARAPEAAAAAINPADWTVCPGCGRFSGLIGAILVAVYQLLLALLGNVNVALCYTLYLVYLLLCIIQITIGGEISIAVSALILILQRLLGTELGGLLRNIGLLLTGLLGCLLRILGVVLPL